MIEDENLTIFAKAEALKEAGNGHFQKGEFRLAIRDYTEAIDTCEDHVPPATPDDSTVAASEEEASDDIGSKKTESSEDVVAQAAETLDRISKEEDKKVAASSKRRKAETESVVCKNLHIYYSNRAFAQLKLENFGSAIADATEAISLKPDFAKAYYRRGVSKYAMTKYREALKDFKILCKLNPTDRDARAKLKDCEKVIQEERFALAIRGELSKPVSETIVTDDIYVDSSYTGPVYNRGDKVDAAWVTSLLEYQKAQKNIHVRYAFNMVLDVLEILKAYTTVQPITVPETGEFTVCGDVHGQYYDLLNIWTINGNPSETNPYLFNGDFVDRGSFSIEVMFALFAWKLCYPEHLFMSRGNHETKNMNKLYGFEGEATKKYNENMYRLFCEAFCYMPLAHTLNEKVFVVHGGLFSKDDVKISDLVATDRIREPPEEGFMTEMLWSDPQPEKGRAPSKRGVGVAFGPDVTNNFLKTNNLSMVVRSHEMKEEGYEVEHDGKCVTVFSAPNYCDQMGNKGAFIRFDGKTMTPKYQSFSSVPHPNVRAMEYANPMLGQFMMGR